MERTENLMLYICDKLKNEATFGSTVFNKVLYYVDNISYLHKGKPVSDFTYIRQKNGPTPTPSSFLPKRDIMCSEGKMAVKESEYFGRIKKVPVNKVIPNLDCFNTEELALIDNVIEAFKDINATVASKFSHDEIAWDIAQDREELPYYTYLLSAESVEQNDVEWANSFINVHN